MANLRREAIGRQCQIRLPGCQTEPTCLAHWRQIGMSGMGMKNFDLCGAWSCHNCHTQVDTTGRGDTEVQLDFARADDLHHKSPLVGDGLPRSVGATDAARNAIVPQVAAEVIGSFMERRP